MSIHNRHTLFSPVLLSLCRMCVYLAGVTVMTVCCHQGQRSHGEGGVSLQAADGRTWCFVTPHVWSEDWVCLACGVFVCACVCVCVPLSVHARAVLQASTLLGNACVPMSVCVCVCVCVCARYDCTAWHRAHSQICSISIHTSTFEVKELF